MPWGWRKQLLCCVPWSPWPFSVLPHSPSMPLFDSFAAPAGSWPIYKSPLFFFPLSQSTPTQHLQLIACVQEFSQALAKNPTSHGVVTMLLTWNHCCSSLLFLAACFEKGCRLRDVHTAEGTSGVLGDVLLGPWKLETPSDPS